MVGAVHSSESTATKSGERRRNGRPEVLSPIDRRDCPRECLRHSGEPAAVRVYLICGLKIAVSVVRFRPWALTYAALGQGQRHSVLDVAQKSAPPSLSI